MFIATMGPIGGLLKTSAHLYLDGSSPPKLMQYIRQHKKSSQRAPVILTLADGLTYEAVAARSGVTDTYMTHWKRRCLEGALLALGDMPRSGTPDRLDHCVATEAVADTTRPLFKFAVHRLRGVVRPT